MTNVSQNFSELCHWLDGHHGKYDGLYEKVRTHVIAMKSSKLLTTTADKIMRIANEELPKANLEQTTLLQKYIIGRSMIEHTPALMARYRSESIHTKMHKNFLRIEKNILDEKSSYEDYDLFVKDVVYVYGECIPCGAQSVSVNGVASIKSLFSGDARRAFGNVFGWMKATSYGGRGWFRPHTDIRILEEFNEPGWDNCYKDIAVLLNGHPEILGMAATAWFYDPKILEISPRLGYLQLRPLERGAFLFRHGPGPHHTAHAIEKSETRRKLVEEGKYIPQSYSLTWPRDALLRWASNN